MFLALAIIGFFTASAQEKSRPMSEMHGNCSSYKTNLAREFSLWKNNASGQNVDKPLEFSKKMSLLLAKQADLKFVVPPEKAFPIKGHSYGGLFQLTSPKNGILRISSGSKAWFDLIDNSTKQIVQSSEFEMQTNCDKIFKTVSFQLKNQNNYTLQVSSSKDPTAVFLLTFD